MGGKFCPENSPEKMNIAMENHELEDEILLQNGCLEESLFIGSTPPRGVTTEGLGWDSRA